MTLLHKSKSERLQRHTGLACADGGVGVDQVGPVSLAFAFAGAGRYVEAAGAVAHAYAGAAAFAGAVFAASANYYEINSFLRKLDGC